MRKIPGCMLAALRNNHRVFGDSRVEPTPGRLFCGRCVHCPDGDGMTLAHGQGVVMLRLWGIDAPEWGQPQAWQSWQTLARLCLQQTVFVVPMERDHYGRTVAETFLADGTQPALLLLLNGLAWYSQKYAPSATHYQTAERMARMQRLGLWKSDNPCPPWSFRGRKQ